MNLRIRIALCVLLAVACADPNDGANDPPASYDTGSGADATGSSSGSSSGSGSSSSSSGSGSSSGSAGFPDGDHIETVNNAAYYENALKLINTAEKRLDVVQFEVKPKGTLVGNLIAAIEQAHDRGVAVRVLLDDEITDNEEVRKRLAAKGVPAKLDSKAKRTHCKLIYADKAFIVGSTNWSQTSIAKNNEANLLVRHKLSRDKVGAYIDKLWTDTTTTIQTSLSTSKIGAVYTDKGYQKVASKLIEKAKSHIELVAYGMNLDPKFTTGPVRDTAKLLGEAVKRGVKVRVLLDQSPWSAITTSINKTALAELAKLGVKVGRLDTEEIITHAKVLIVDDAVVLGTNNWGMGGFEFYHEVGLRTHEEKVVGALLTYFDGIWEDSK